jgi:hypothetical protein
MESFAMVCFHSGSAGGVCCVWLGFDHFPRLEFCFFHHVRRIVAIPICSDVIPVVCICLYIPIGHDASSKIIEKTICLETYMQINEHD